MIYLTGKTRVSIIHLLGDSIQSTEKSLVGRERKKNGNMDFRRRENWNREYCLLVIRIKRKKNRGMVANEN